MIVFERTKLKDFADFGLAPALLRALAKEGYVTPTPIQAQAIPYVMEGRDLLGIAQTGTGKTAAFALPILNKLLADPQPAPKKGCRVLVLSPTRELATQIANSFRALSSGCGLHVATVFGGVSYSGQIRALSRGVDVLVATAGRLVDHLDTGAADLKGVEILVLDEVDQMLDLGFVKPIRRIVRDMSSRRQNLFFSATMPRETRALANELLIDPVEVSVASESKTADRIEQKVMLVETRRKREVLISLFDEAAMSRAIVFTRTKHGADRVAEHLEKAGITAEAIHGNKSQGQRERALQAFRAGKSRVLVATDVAARGIDIDGVTHVINYEMPDVAERYVHRIGRTARAGAAGIAISLCDGAESGLLRDIEKLTQLKLPVDDLRSAETKEEEERRSTESRQRKPAGRNGAGAGRKFQGKRSEGRPARSGEGRGEGRPARSGEGRPSEGRPARSAEGRPARSGEGRPARSAEGRPARSAEGHEGRPARSSNATRPARQNSDARPPRTGADAPLQRKKSA